jgi:hypothetical protein
MERHQMKQAAAAAVDMPNRAVSEPETSPQEEIEIKNDQ